MKGVIYTLLSYVMGMEESTYRILCPRGAETLGVGGNRVIRGGVAPPLLLSAPERHSYILK